MQAEDETKVVERDLSSAESEPAGPGDAGADASELPNGASPSSPAESSETTPVAEERVAAEGERLGPRGSTAIDLLTTQRLVGRYELIHRLGYGGMATVYLGRAIGTAGFERLVAVKVIHPHLASEPEFVEMFLDEARIAAKIHHPHVVEIIDLGRDDELFFMVMEYVEGENLAALLREMRKRGEKIAVSAALQIVSDVCGGLAAAHDLKDHDGKRLELVHRDVSPHNFLISMDGRVRVVDFGIMKAAGKRSTTLTGQLRGKVPYMSPEQAKAKVVDHRTDIFALGAVLWELLAGERLFLGETESETLAKVVQCKVPDIFERRDDLPRALRPILDQALAADPDDRYASAQAMLKDVRAVLRQLDEDEPREVLAGYMKRFFSSRIDYIHATIRGYAMGEQAGRSAGDLSFSRTTPHGAGASVGIGRLTPSQPAGLGPQTLTTSVGVTARQWPLWLLLPLAGAVIGTLVVRTWDADGGDRAPRPAPDVTPASAEREPAPPSEAVPQTPAGPEMVKWWFNTDPQGATVTIDGREYPSPTPVAIELPRRDEPVSIRVEKEGYRPKLLELVPLGNQNVRERLERSTEEDDAGASNRPVRPRFQARTKPKSGSPSEPASDGASDPPAGESAGPADSPPKDEPRLGELPDFDLVRNKKTP